MSGDNENEYSTDNQDSNASHDCSEHQISNGMEGMSEGTYCEICGP